MQGVEGETKRLQKMFGLMIFLIEYNKQCHSFHLWYTDECKAIRYKLFVKRSMFVWNIKLSISSAQLLTHNLTSCDSLLIPDVPKTYKGYLEVTKEEKLVYDESSGQWHVQLTCGNFSDKGHPHIDVIWRVREWFFCVNLLTCNNYVLSLFPP